MIFPKLSNSELAYFWFVIKKTSKNIKNSFLKKQHTLHKQATSNDGLWRVRKFSGQF